MPKKIQYRAVDVHHLSLETLLSDFAPSERVVVGIDVAKHKFLAALSDTTGAVCRVVRFEHPTQTLDFVQLLDGLHNAGRTVETCMEPTGTYGDALRYQLGLRSLPVFRVNNKHVHDAAEVFDRSASKHDAKDACLIAWLHALRRSAPWPELSEERRNIRALVAQRELFDVPLRRLVAQIEPMLARHFPELETFFDLSRRKTPYRLLETYGSAAGLAQAGMKNLTTFLQRSSRRKPDPDVVAALVQAAKTTQGVAMVPAELQLVRMTSSEILRLFTMREQIDRLIETAATEAPAVQALRPALGAVTAAVVFAYLGDANDYSSAAAFEKAAGLNLIERSSGNDIGSKHLSKRGSGAVRKYLFLAAMRLIQKEPVVHAWYQARASYKVHKIKALVAVQRKLCRALFHVAKGQPLDVAKLFDTRRLKLPSKPEAA
jgi:transposase